MSNAADVGAAEARRPLQHHAQGEPLPAPQAARVAGGEDGGLEAEEGAAVGVPSSEERRPASVSAVGRSRSPSVQAQLDLSQAPALYALLECIGCSTTQVHAACLAAVKARLLSLVAEPNADREKLRNLAHKALAYVDVPELREITLALVAAHREAVGDETLERLVRDQQLLSDAPVAAKQAIWLRDPTLLPEYLGPLLDAYASDEELHAASLEMVWQREGDAGAQPDTWSPGGAAALEGVTTVGIIGRDIVSLTKMRRSYPIVRQIIKAFGETEELYGQIMPLCRLGFRNASEASGKHVYPEMIGTLSADLIMTLHQSHFEHLSGRTSEEIHTLIWNMDACKGGGLLDISRINELNSKCFGHLEPDSPTYIDAAIVLLDPYTQNMFASTILHCLEELAPHVLNGLDGLRQDQEKLLEIVEWSTNLAELGRRAKSMAEIRACEMPHIFDSSFRKFYWFGMARMIQLDLDQTKKPSEKRSGVSTSAKGEELLEKEHYNLMNEYDIPLRVYVHYVLSRAAAADAAGVRRGLRPLLGPDGPLPSFRYLSAAAWQSLVSVLLRPVPMRRLLSAEDPTFRRACVDDGLLVAASNDEFANLQLARLALEVLDGAERLLPENTERLDEMDAARNVEKVRHTAADVARVWAESVMQHQAKWTNSRPSFHDATIRKLLAAYLRRAAANALPSAFATASSAYRRRAAMYNYHRDIAIYLFGEWQQRHHVSPAPSSTHKRGRPDEWAAVGQDDQRAAKSVDTGGNKGDSGEEGGDELMWLD